MKYLKNIIFLVSLFSMLITSCNFKNQNNEFENNCDTNITEIQDSSFVNDALFADTRNIKDGYWIFWTRAFIYLDPIIVTIHKEIFPYIITHVYDGVGLFGYCNLSYTDTTYISNEQLDYIEEVFNKIDLNSQYEVFGVKTLKNFCFDGDFWFFEKINNNQQTIIERRCCYKEVDSIMSKLFNIIDFYKKNTIEKYKGLKESTIEYKNDIQNKVKANLFFRNFNGIQDDYSKASEHSFCIILDKKAHSLVGKITEYVGKNDNILFDVSEHISDNDFCNKPLIYEGIKDTSEFYKIADKIEELCNYVINEMNFEELNKQRLIENEK